MSSRPKGSTRTGEQVDRQSVAETEQRLLAEAEALLSSVAAFVGQTRNDLNSLRSRLEQAAKAPGATMLPSLGGEPSALLKGAAGIFQYVEESGFNSLEECVRNLTEEGGVLRAAVASHADNDLDAFASLYTKAPQSDEAGKVVASYADVLLATLKSQPVAATERPAPAN